MASVALLNLLRMSIENPSLPTSNKGKYFPHAYKDTVTKIYLSSCSKQGLNGRSAITVIFIMLLYVSVTIYIEQLIIRLVVCFDIFHLLVKAVKMIRFCLCLAKIWPNYQFRTDGQFSIFMRCFISWPLWLCPPDKNASTVIPLFSAVIIQVSWLCLVTSCSPN